ncbi:MAG: cytochrome b561 [Planctomycetota bacterium]|nr:MAG: cytochrome b561 [Planctomycetota bacterium]
MLRRLYDWILDLSKRPIALPAMTLLSLAESSFFPIPPDVMLIPMCVANRARALVYAFWCSFGSVVGGVIGYAIGYFLWDDVSGFFFDLIPGFDQELFDSMQGYYEEWNFWIVFAAGFTVIPYKIFTISGGVFAVGFPMFVVASALSRSARFFLEAYLIKRYGEKAQVWIEERFNLVATVLVAVLILAVVGLSMLKH